MKKLCTSMIVAICALDVHAQTVLGTSSKSLNLEQLPMDSEATPTSTDLIGGQVANRQDFPGVFYTRQGNSRCTGTLVGERVVATAAHCVSNGGSLALSYEGKDYRGTCTHHGSYRNNATADYALCVLSEAIPDAVAETINTDASRLSKGLKLTLMGYGCTKAGGSGGNDGQLRTGKAPITSLPSGTNYDIVTKGSTALCYGDSGGPSFFVNEATGERFQTGINSRGDISTTSYLSSLHVKTAQDFYKSWSASKRVKICGIHPDATNCRQQSEPLPEACLTAAENLNSLTLCTSAANPPAGDVCSAAINNVQACLTARELQ